MPSSRGGAIREALARRADLVDMEGFAVARACARAGVPCEIVKVVSDDASHDAGAAWLDGIDTLARVIAEVVARELEEPRGP